MAEQDSSTKTKEELTAELLPPEGNDQVGFKVFEILAEILEDKNNLGLPTKWMQNYELGKNKHWKQTAKKVPLLTANLLFTHRQRTVNTLTDNNPTFNVSRTAEAEESKEDVYNKLLRTAEYWWNEQEQQAVLEKSVINGETYGCTIEKSVFNPDLEYNLGEVEAELVDPFHFGFYPVKCKDIQKAEAILHFWPMSLREARRKWPEFANKIHSDTEHLKELGEERREVQGGRPQEPRGYLTTFAGIVKNMLNLVGGGKAEADELLIVEAWTKDYTMLKDEEENEKQSKYPGYIRCVQTCCGGEVILSDKTNPSINPDLDIEQAQKTYLFDKFPFTLTPSITDPVNPWGMSDYEQLESLQIELDKTLSQLTLMKDKTARLKIINPKSSGVPNRHFSNVPGIINPINAAEGTAIRYMENPQIDATLWGLKDVYKDLFFLVAGTFELELAKKPGREVVAYKALAALMEHAATMMRGKIRNYSRMIRERGRMYLSHVQNWYTEDRWITYEEDGQDVPTKIRGSELIIPAKLTVVSGSTMPRSQVQEREEAIGLLKMGAIDFEALLKKIDWPDWKNVAKRMKAGPMGEFLEKLMAMGVPEQLMMLFQQVAQMDKKEFKKNLEKGEIPPFQALLPALTGQEPQAPPVSPLEMMEAELKAAEVRKTMAETLLVEEKVRTEQIDQFVKQAGVMFDQELLKQKRAELVAKIEVQRDKAMVDTTTNIARIDKLLSDRTVSSAKGRGTAPFRERGLSSDNQEI